jgi:hypothetical protein
MLSSSTTWTDDGSLTVASSSSFALVHQGQYVCKNSVRRLQTYQWLRRRARAHLGEHEDGRVLDELDHVLQGGRTGRELYNSVESGLLQPGRSSRELPEGSEHGRPRVAESITASQS